MKIIDSLWDMTWLVAVFILCLALPAYAQPASTPAIPESNWHYHILLPEQIVDVCSAFIDQRGHHGLPIACSFKNMVTHSCHIFLAPGAPGSLFAKDYEERRCAGLEQ